MPESGDRTATGSECKSIRLVSGDLEPPERKGFLVSVTTEEWEQLKAKLTGATARMDETLFSQAMQTREPSKAWLVGSGGRSADSTTSGQAGAWITALTAAGSREADLQAKGKASLQAMGITWDDGPVGTTILGGQSGRRGGWSLGKATLGTSTATGLAIVPNNVVDKLVEIATAENIYRNLMTWIPGVGTAGVDIPVEQAAPLRALVAPFGSTKENVDITYLRYSATLYTISRIHDVGNQLLRFSAGAAEQDVVDRLGRAFGLGEAYYTLSGAGTTEPLGILTAIGTSGSYYTSKNAATTTFATSILGAIISGMKAVAGRAVKPTAITMHPTDFFTMCTEVDSGTNRPFVVGFLGSAEGAIDSNATLNIFGVPIYQDPNLPVNTALVGDFKSVRCYTGLGYRIDSSSEAGTRFDTNETGFRGEEEFGFTAAPFVNAGKLQRIGALNT